MTFSDLKIDQDMVDALAAKGIIEPFPIQQEAIPLALEGNDIIGQAKTGTGKTLGFGLPLLQHLGPHPEPGVKALVVVPTRELAVQVTEDIEAVATARGTTVVTIYGGKAYEGQIAQLKAGAQVVVGTPGRLIDLANQHILNLSNVKVTVLDEADKMLDLGFLPDVERIFQMVNPVRQTMLFSATMPGPVVALARRFMTRPIHVRVAAPDEGQTQANIEQFIYRAHALDKDEVIARILQAEGRGRTIIFMRTKRAASKLAEELEERGFKATAVHGDLNQEARERHLNAFKSGKYDVLVATDVAARGIDVDDVTHVINHSIPDDEDDYLHRIGRTGRAGKTGVAVTFVDWADSARWAMINKALDFGQPEPTETYSTSEHLFANLHIPADATGRLPGAHAKTPKRDEASSPRSSSGGSRSGGSRRGSAARDGGREGGRARQQGAPRAEQAVASESAPTTDSPEGTSHHREGRRRRRRTRGSGTPSAPPQS